MTIFWTPEMKKHLQKNICILGPAGIDRIVMLCVSVAPQQANPEQGRHESVHNAWIPAPLLLINKDMTYKLYDSVLKPSPRIFAALRTKSFFCSFLCPFIIFSK